MINKGIPSKKEVILFLPSKRFGGSELLFEELFYYLASNDYNVSLVDFKDGVFFSRVKKEYRSNLIAIEDFDSKTGEKGLLISSTSHLHQLNTMRLKGNWKVVFLVLHKFHIINYLIFSKLYKKFHQGINTWKLRSFENKNWRNLSRFVAELASKGGLVYFNNSTLLLHKNYFKFDESPFLTRLPFKNYNTKLIEPKGRLSKSILNFGWVSRLDSDLFPSLKTITELLSNVKTIDKELIIHVIGDGDFLDKVPELETEQLRVKKVGPLYGDELYTYLYNYIDIGVGRGTISLNYSSVGIPSILTPLPIEKKQSKEQFIFGYERLDDYSKEFTLDDIISKIINDYESISNKSIEDVKLYSADTIFPKMIEYSLKSNIGVQDVAAFLESQSLLYKLKRRIKNSTNA